MAQFAGLPEGPELSGEVKLQINVDVGVPSTHTQVPSTASSVKPIQNGLKLEYAS
jgi:hypothetical protein